MKPIKLKGLFWTPENPDHKVHGIITVTNSLTFKLKLRGCLFISEDDHKNFEEVVLGKTSRGLVTLVGCVLGAYRSQGGEIVASKYGFGRFYQGQHLEKPNELLLNEAVVHFPYLQEWLGKSGVGRSNLGIKGDQSAVEMIQLEPIEVPLSDGIIRICFDRNPLIGRFQVGIKQNSVIHFKLTKSVVLDDFFNDYILPIQDFLNIVNGRVNVVKSVRFFQRYTYDQVVEHFNPLDSFEVIQGQFFRNVELKKKEAKYHKNDELITFKKVEANFENILSHWMEVSKELEPVRNLFRQERLAVRLFVDRRMLLIVQGLEYFHRVRNESWKVPREVIKPLRRSIVKRTPAAHRSWINDAFQWAGQKSLRERIHELTDNARGVMHQIGVDSESFAKAVADTRNYYTHFSQASKGKALHGEDLAWLTECVMVLLQSCFLTELGYPIAEQPSTFLSNNRYNMLFHSRQQIRDIINSRPL